MAGSTFGTIFKITTWGESHGKALGVVIDGCPAGLALTEADIQPYLDRRKPGQTSISTPRKESDQVEILSGVFEGKTTGTPISLIIPNTSQKSSDYSEIASYYRPGHADLTYDSKYGFRDYRGGGRSSGRETAGRVAAGAVAAKLLKEMGITVTAYTSAIGPISIDMTQFSRQLIFSTATCMPDEAADKEAMAYLKECMENKDSCGGIVECVIDGLPSGIGDPVFEKLDANLAKAVMSIGAVKAVEIGDGFKAAGAKGSANNDAFQSFNGKIYKTTNHAGGILGGISDGSQIILRAHIKPTPSIFSIQKTVNKDMENIEIAIKGRHDPVIVPRAVVVVEAMAALTVLDACMLNLSAKLDYLTAFYKR
ncbi:chorismate synthase [Parablautia muri]|uniref:Chorismate synthase n=1 Tax=Parablautia muri TaxID=2320879 RepID=A0A9X5BEH0_9FIRM|nr:chorismate synthase [Parablautia muri]NBJ92128.1 chorismate synthase [Parablautia muri]